jgi:hypothetical protein
METTKTYTGSLLSPVTCNNCVWLVTDKEILLKKANFDQRKPLKFEELTLVADSRPKLISEIEDNWKIFSDETDLFFIGSTSKYFSNFILETGHYILEVSLAKEEKDLIVERFDGEFKDFLEFKNLLEEQHNKYFFLDNDCLDELISYLLNR